MPRLTDVFSRTDGLYESASHILLHEGPRRLSFRALARARNMSLGSLADHYESRRRLFHLLCQIASDEWVKDLQWSVLERGLSGFLPLDDEEVGRARVWASWVELSRADPELRGTVGDTRLRERHVLASAVHSEDDELLDLWLATVDGLRHRVIAPLDALPVDRALHLLHLAVDGGRTAA